MALTAGSCLGPYEVLAPLGAGGMGEVYRARDPRLGPEVAVKVLPEAFSRDAERLARFGREARALAALSHPNILTVHDIGNQDGTVYIVSELLEGETLRNHLGSGRVRDPEVVEQATQIARGLAAAGEKGLVHRDLKPANLFLTKDGLVKILDFGLAKAIEPAAPIDSDADTAPEPPVTDPGTAMGTAGYMSPEQVRGRKLDHRSDIFSFGTVLYEMLSGKPAFHGDSAVETLNAILTQEPAALSREGAETPPGLERILRRCPRAGGRWCASRGMDRWCASGRRSLRSSRGTPKRCASCSASRIPRWHSR